MKLTTFEELKDCNIEEDAYDFIASHYRGEPNLRELFFWLWRKVHARCGAATCERKARYIGFYSYTGNIFAYVDPQKGVLKIGIEDSLIESLITESVRVTTFPSWSNKRLTGFWLTEEDQEMVEILIRAHAKLECSGVRRRRGSSWPF